MSDQLTSQSRPSSGISRRTALRGAAWSASAVTVVVATPNIAAATPGTAIEPSTTVTAGTPIKYSVQDAKFVAWDIAVTCSNMDLKGLVLLFSYNQTGGGGAATLDKVKVHNFPAAATWSASVTKPSMVATAAATYGGIVARGTTADIHVQFEGSDNSSGQVSVTVMAEDSTGAQVVVGSTGMTTWDTGKEHAH
jgi:hypothetical protein